MNMAFIYLIVKGGRKGTGVQSLSNVYIYKSEANPKRCTRINRETRSREKSERAQWKGSYIKDIGAALWFIYHHIWFLFAILLSRLLFYLFFLSLSTFCVLVVCTLSVSVCKLSSKNAAHTNSRNETLTDTESRTRSKWIWHCVIFIMIRVFNHDYRTQTLIHLADDMQSKHIHFILYLLRFFDFYTILLPFLTDRFGSVEYVHWGRL